jgi:hypothetical protein
MVITSFLLFPIRCLLTKSPSIFCRGMIEMYEMQTRVLN